MNKPNPLVPQGTFADKSKSHIRLTVFAILAVHVVLLGVLLIAGCNKKDSGAPGGDPGLPPVVAPLTPDSNAWPGQPSLSPVVVTSPPVTLPPVILPPPAPETPVPMAPAFTEHTIVKNDSFYTLGKQYKVGYKAIADANPGVDSTRLKIGQKVRIPAPKAARTGASDIGIGASAPGSPGGDTVYTVKSGDNLIKIAKTHGISPKELQAANNLRTTQIRVGQKLKIPGKTPVTPPDAAAPPPGTPSPTPIP